MAKKTKDERLREELKAFVEDYNKREGTSFKSTGVKGSEFRRSSKGHSKGGAVDFGAESRSKEGRKKSAKFIKEMAKRGFRVIDERDAKSRRTGKNNRNVIHIDALTRDRSDEAWDERGTIRKETSKKKYPVVGKEKQMHFNPEKEAPLSKLRELSRLDKIKKKGILEKALESTERLINPEVQSKEIMSKGEQASFSKPKGMSKSLRDKLAFLSLTNPESQDFGEQYKAILEGNVQEEISKQVEAAPKIASIQDMDGTPMPLEEEKEELKKKVEVIKDLPPSHVQRKIKQETSTDKAAKANVEKTIQRAEQGQSTVSDQFKEALSFFAPTLMGALGGALIEGTEGAVAGAETATSLGDSFRKFQLEKAKLAQKDQPSQYQAKSLELRQKQLELEERAEGRRDKGLDLNFAKFGFDKKKASQLSEKQVGKLQDIISVEKSIDRIDALREEVNTGPLAGRVQSLAAWADLAPESFNRMKARTASTLSNYVKSISGAQVTEAEAVRLAAVIPDVNDSPSVFKDKLEEFKKIVEENKKAFAEAIRTGQPLREGQIKGLLRAESRFMKQPSRRIMSKEQKSRLQELRNKYGK